MDLANLEFKTNELMQYYYEYLMEHRMLIVLMCVMLFLLLYFMVVIRHRKKYIKNIGLIKRDYLSYSNNTNIFKDQWTYVQKEGIRLFRSRNQPDTLTYVAPTTISYPETLRKN